MSEKLGGLALLSLSTIHNIIHIFGRITQLYE